MNIDVTVLPQRVVIGSGKNSPLVGWPKDWPVPPVGAEVEIPGWPTLYVRLVEWWPMGDPDNGLSDPFVHVVLGEQSA